MRTSLHQHERAQPDEGYSEENGDTDTEMCVTYLQDEHFKDVTERNITDPKVQKILAEALLLPMSQRAELAHTLIPTLPNPVKEQLAALIEGLTHFDPTLYLPDELVLNIFSYLSPEDLLRASRISRGWRVRALDEKLWRMCFAREGWVLDRERMQKFERQYQEITDAHGPKVVEGLMENELGWKGKGKELERKGSRKRGRDEAFSDGEAAGTGLDGEMGGLRRGQSSADDMEGVEAASPLETPSARDLEVDSIAESFSETPSRYFISHSPTNIISKIPSPRTTSTTSFKLAPTLFQSVPNNLKISWPYLYKHRRRLERNWEQKKCIPFQLPHPDYPQEGHRECIYTIQHTATHLVSGSRDTTIRIWDLSTYRLKRTPLRGHEASVLCLQFDERPDHDIIVSGGSDAFVIIWKFSTGEIIRKMTRAHEESVLNLRFDDRYIVTCSKDKTIKVWNRFALPYATPLIPTHVLSHFNGSMETNDIIAEYTLLTTLLGHQAAVNAVQIHNDTIVSVSGDRTIKSWSLSSPSGGSFMKNYIGHTKGIACVQFDGRRIVSGSSDATVRIFDAEQCAEVACLAGHESLVRTVQARFGDLGIVSDEELAEEARAADIEFYKAVDNGLISRRGASTAQTADSHPSSAAAVDGRGTGVRRGRLRNTAGSNRPEDMLSLGTKIPPGGGGSRWAKIVSGSYDESVILWKKDKDGGWFKMHEFNQREVLNAGRGARGAARARRGAAAGAGGDNDGGDGGGGGDGGVQAPANAAGPSTAAQAQADIARATQLIRSVADQYDSGQGGQHSNPANQTAAQNHLGTHLGQHQQAHLQSHVNASTQTTTTAAVAAGAAGPSVQVQSHHSASASSATPAAAAASTSSPANTTASPPVLSAAAQAGATQLLTTLVGNIAQQPGGPQALAPLAGVNPPPQQQQQQQQQQQHHHRAGNGESNRVFKLQFDPRRIVCCSQNKVIVGWDFANGDVDLERVGGWCLETA